MGVVIHALLDATLTRHTGRMTTTGTPNRRLIGAVLMVGSGVSNQVGAAVGSWAFPVIAPVGVVVMRQFVAALVLVPIARPRLRSFTWAQWWPVLLLGVVFGVMNLALYSSIERIGLGLAVTLEFLGPLAVALIGSRSRAALLCALVAAVGVVAITQPQPSTDYLGIALGLVAATCWASYILLNRIVGSRIPGAQGAAAAALVSATLFVPVGIVAFLAFPPTLAALGLAVVAGVLSSAVPYIADLTVLRWVPPGLFGLLMSINPILAALTGAILLSQELNGLEWAGIALVVAANAAGLAVSSRQSRLARVLP